MIEGLRALRAGLTAKGILLARRARAERDRSSARVLGMVLFSVFLIALVFGLTYAGGRVLVVKGVPEVARSGVSFSLLGLSFALILSSLGHAASSFFSARDLWMWDCTPAPPWARFFDRFVETGISALPMMVIFGNAGLLGLVLGAQLGVWAAVRVVVATTLTTLVPLSIGIALAHVGGGLLPAGKLRRLTLVVIGVLTAAGLVWFRRQRFELFLTPEGAARLLEGAKGLSGFVPAWMPASHGARFVLDNDLAGLAGLGLWSFGAVGVALVSHVLCFQRARDLAIDESPVGLVRGSGRERMLRTALLVVPSRMRPLVEKDLLAFARDPAQWGQLVLLVGVGVLYLVNAEALRKGFQDLPSLRSTVLAAMHTGLVTFVAAGLAARFAFPQVGLEGPAVWIVDGSPLTPRDLLRAKWIASIPIVSVFPTLVGLLGGYVLELDTGTWAMTTVLVFIVALALAAFGVGRGAIAPLFDATTVSELAMAPGAVSTMLLSVVVSGLASIGAGVAGGAIEFSPAPRNVVVPLIACIVPAAIAVELARGALQRGAHAFVRRREDEAQREFARAH
jgi:hypothetical protein